MYDVMGEAVKVFFFFPIKVYLMKIKRKYQKIPSHNNQLPSNPHPTHHM